MKVSNKKVFLKLWWDVLVGLNPVWFWLLIVLNVLNLLLAKSWFVSLFSVFIIGGSAILSFIAAREFWAIKIKTYRRVKIILDRFCL
jgi:hypothetical protein